MGNRPRGPTKKILAPDNKPFIALGDRFFAMDRDGEPFWEGNLPKEFMNNLRGRPRHLPRVDFVAFGPGDAYFEQFSKGKNHWNGISDDFDDAMNNHSGSVVH